MGSSIASLVTSGTGSAVEPALAPGAPLGKGVADCAALDAGGAAVGGLGCAVWAEARVARKSVNEPARTR
jgi:hypothetical protein